MLPELRDLRQHPRLRVALAVLGDQRLHQLRGHATDIKALPPLPVAACLEALFAAGAVFAIGLGFAMQNIVQNFVSGVILLAERTIKPGDVLQVDGRFVKVRHMGIRSTICRTLDEEEIIVPNATIVQSTVTNYTLQDSLFRLRCTVGVVYGSDMVLVKNTLQRAAQIRQ